MQALAAILIVIAVWLVIVLRQTGRLSSNAAGLAMCLTCGAGFMACLSLGIGLLLPFLALTANGISISYPLVIRLSEVGMLQSTVIALCVCIWTIALIGLGAEPTPWLSVRRGHQWHELIWRGRARRVRYTAAWRGDSRYRSLEVLSV